VSPPSSSNGAPTQEALRAARRHLALAEKHERAVARHEELAQWLAERGENAQAEVERRNAMLARDAAQDELQRAGAIQGPTQMTRPKTGDPLEIPIPSREDFMRNLEKVAPKPVATPDAIVPGSE
jgi:hypothetical protein